MAEQTKLRVAGEHSEVLVRALGHDAELCLRETSAESKCQRCADICPGNALRITSDKSMPGGSKVTLSKGFCIDCGLCAAVCPTGGINVLEPTLRTLRRRLRQANAQSVDDGHVYITCVETGLAKSDLSVVEVACLGMLGWEAWANLMLEFPNLAVYLPDDICGRCKAKKAIDLIFDNVCHAQDVVGRELLLVESMRELDFTNKDGALLPDRRAKMRESKEDSFSNILQDLTTQHVDEDSLPSLELGQLDAKRMRNRLRKEITNAEGEDTPGIRDADSLLGTITQSRWALLDALMRYPQIAERAEITYVQIDASKAGAEKVAKCAQECPLGAIHVADNGSCVVRPELCCACGHCEEICGAETGAVTTITMTCDALLP